MKKTLLTTLLLFFSITLHASDMLDTFIDTQIKTEAQFLDQNITLKKKVTLKKEQAKHYRDFFLHYAGEKDENLKKINPYKDEINKLTFRLHNNQYLGNNNAVFRDEVLLKEYDVRNALRETLQSVLLSSSNSESKAFFKDKLGEILVKHFSKYKPLETKKFSTEEQNSSSPVVISLKKELQTFSHLENVVNTFSAELIENSENIYRTISLSKSKIFTLVNNINQTKLAHTLNDYLSLVNLDSGQVILILLIVFFLIFIQLFIHFIANRFLAHKAFKEEDISYIHSHITKIFNILTSLIIMHLILVVYLGFDSKSINISKLFAIAYVILTALLLYRITNTIAFFRVERIKNSVALKNEVVNLALKVSNSIILILALIAILKIVGIDLTTLLSGLGIAGAAIAFAAKDSIANIFGSIAILAGDIFEQGDWIESKDANGTVVEIGLRATTIRTFDNALISVPNFELSNSGVKNWSRRSIGRRIKMNLGVTYESDMKDIKQAIEEIKEMLKEHPGIANEHTKYINSTRQAKLVSIEDFKGIKRTTLVYMDEFTDSSINILVYCFTRTVVWDEWLEVKEDVMFKIADILKQNHLEFAYPTMMIHQTHNTEE